MLERAVRDAPLWEVRKAAIKRLTDSNILKRIALSELSEMSIYFKRTAFELIDDHAFLYENYHLYLHTLNTKLEIEAALDRVKEKTVLESLLTHELASPKPYPHLLGCIYDRLGKHEEALYQYAISMVSSGTKGGHSQVCDTLLQLNNAKK